MTLHCPNCHHVLTPPARALTERQAQVLQFIEQRIGERGYAPTLSEIAGRFNFQSLATVHEHLTNLERKGFGHRVRPREDRARRRAARARARAEGRRVALEA